MNKPSCVIRQLPYISTSSKKKGRLTLFELLFFRYHISGIQVVDILNVRMSKKKFKRFLHGAGET